MEHLTKQQIVLLTLLVSFVTSIATGIVTVSLINQAPAGTTNTIERVIENTVAAALPADNLATVGQSNSSEDSLTSIVSSVEKGVVKIQDYGIDGSVTGLGVVINGNGTVMTDKSNIVGLKNIAVAYADGDSYNAVVIQQQINGDLVFLAPILSSAQASSTSFSPISIRSFPKLGEMVASLGGTDAGTLGVGVFDRLVSADASSSPFAVSTTIDPSKVLPGSPLFDISGNLIGLQTSSLASKTDSTSKTEAEFYLIAPIKAALPK